MHILRVIASMDPATGGPCQGIRNTVPAMDQLGVVTEVVCLDDPQASFIQNNGFKVHAVGKGKTSWQKNKNLSTWLRANLNRFDAVIIHGLWLYHGYATAREVKWYRRNNPTKNKLKLYVMPHGMLDPWFQKAEGRKLKAIRNNIYWKLVEQHIVNGADGVLFTCEEELLLARKSFSPYHPQKELNVGYGISIPPQYDSELQSASKQLNLVPDGTPYLLFLSRIHAKKGIDILISAFLEIEKKYDASPYLVIAGPGLETAFGQYIQQLAQPSKKILFPGMLSGNSKWSAFYNCAAFILPSHQENFGIAVVEALACAKPVLISKQINIWREIQSGSAAIVDEDTQQGVYNMIENWVLLDNAGKLSMSKNAATVFENNFTNVSAAKQMYNALFSIQNQAADA